MTSRIGFSMLKGGATGCANDVRSIPVGSGRRSTLLENGEAAGRGLGLPAHAATAAIKNAIRKRAADWNYGFENKVWTQCCNNSIDALTVK